MVRFINASADVIVLKKYSRPRGGGIGPAPPPESATSGSAVGLVPREHCGSTTGLPSIMDNPQTKSSSLSGHT